MIEQEFRAFREAAMPLMQWLADNRHPHVTVIVDSERAELLEGQANARRVSKEHELDKRDRSTTETERLKGALKDAITEIGRLQNLAPVIPPTTTRAEPSRLEIAAMIYAGVEYVDDDDAFKAADKLIAAAKKGK